MQQLPLGLPLTPRCEHANRIEEKLRRELGPQICGWLADPAIIEIMLNADGSLWVERLCIGATNCSTTCNSA